MAKANVIPSFFSAEGTINIGAFDFNIYYESHTDKSLICEVAYKYPYQKSMDRTGNIIYARNLASKIKFKHIFQLFIIGEISLSIDGKLLNLSLTEYQK